MRHILWRRTLLWWSLTILWCGFIFFLSANIHFTGHSTRQMVQEVVAVRSPMKADEINFGLRKTAHVILFFVLGALAWQAIRTWPAPKSARSLAWLLAILYAASDEWHQTMVPGRSGLWSDVLLDSAAAAVAVLLMPFLAHQIRVRRTRSID